MIARATEQLQAETTDTVRRRALIAGCLGNLVEWYDFALYGAFAAIIAATFFAGDDAAGGLTATFGIFGIAFLARPAGAVLFAHYGDRHGRRRALAAGILLMAVATAGIGTLPGYARIGWLAPVLLTVLRIAQGVAVGGEYGGSAALVVEYAPADQRGWYGGWQYASVGIGLAAGIGTAAVLGATLPASALREWGWRLPFLAALPLGIIGIYVRTRLDETPAFRATQHVGVVARDPLREAATTYRRHALIGFSVVAAIVVTFNTFYVFLPSYLAAQGTASLERALGAALVGLVIASTVAPVFGAVSDRVGRRPVLVGSVLTMLVAIIPASRLVASGDNGSMILGYCLVGIALGALPISAFLAELFPTRLRYSGLSLTYGLGSAVFGSTAPFVAAVLVGRTGLLGGPMWYATAVVAVAVVAAFLAPETADRSLDG